MSNFAEWLILNFWPLLKEHWGIPVGMVVLSIYGFHHFNARSYQLANEEGDIKSAITARQLALALTRVAAPPKFTTRRDRYQRYSQIYVFGLEALFLLIVFAPEIFIYMLQLAGQAELELPGTIGERVLWALFGLTGLLSSFPVLRDLEAKVIESLHQWAAIPKGADHTATRLFNGKYTPGEAAMDEAVDKLSETQFKAIDFKAKTVDELDAKFFHVVCLQTQLFQLLRTDKYRIAWQVFESERVALEKELHYRKQKIIEYLTLKKESVSTNVKDVDNEPAPTDEGENGFLQEKLDKLILKIDAHRYRLCLLASLAVYASEKRSEYIEPVFRQLGFDVEIKSLPPVDSETLFKAGFVIVVATLVPAIAYEVFLDVREVQIPGEYKDRVPGSMRDAMIWSASIIFLHCVALCGGMRLKRFFTGRRWRDAALPGSEALRSNFVENIYVFFSFYLISYILGCVLFSFFYGFDVLTAGIIWSAVPASTAFFVAHYMSQATNSDNQGSQQFHFILQGLVTGGLALSASLIVTHPEDNFNFTSWPDIVWIYAVYVTAVSMCTGMGIGWLFPRTYRRRLNSDAQEPGAKIPKELQPG